MLKKNTVLLLFIFGFCVIVANANTNVDNTYGPGNVDAHGNLVDPVSLLPESAVRNLLIVKYTTFNYTMKPKDFYQFFAKYKLHQSTELKSSTNIVRAAELTNKELDVLNMALTKKIYGMGMVIPPTGRYYCNIHGGGTPCQGSEILFKPNADKDGVAVKISINHKNAYPEAFSLNSEALLNKVKNKNYVLITQTKKHDALYGQIILIAFGK